MVEVRSFLCLASNYRSFIQEFYLIATPLSQLTHKGVKYDWDGICEKRFQELKDQLTLAPILSIPIGE